MILEAGRNANFPFFRVCPLSLIFVLSFRISLVLIYCKRLFSELLVGRNRPDRPKPYGRNDVVERWTYFSFFDHLRLNWIRDEVRCDGCMCSNIRFIRIVSRYISWVRSIYNRFLFRAAKTDCIFTRIWLSIYCLALVSSMLLLENKFRE